MSIEFIHSEAMAYMRTVPDNTFDSSPTDPPYGLKFMGKAWDHSVPSVEFWREHLRIMKPGAFILVACGTRTQHRMAVNIEDAGYEIRDVITWHYGQGFPKSLDVSKAIDKYFGTEREVVGKGKSGHTAIWSDKGDMGNFDITAPATAWDGWGTALKPATEFWTLARKPIEGTVAENVLKYGTGGLNIDGCRIYTNDDTGLLGGADAGLWSGKKQIISEANNLGRWPANVIFDEYVGALLDKQTGVLTLGSCSSDYIIKENKTTNFKNNERHMMDRAGNSGGASRFFYCPKPRPEERNKGLEKWEKKLQANATFRPNHLEDALNGESGKPHGRYKAVQNNHPTVKPINLMRYLVRLITPPGGTCYDPFNGSGTTGIACKLEGFNYVGTDSELEYIDMSRARAAAYHRENTQMSLL